MNRGIKYLTVGAVLLISACDTRGYYSNSITHQQEWQHYADTVQANREYEEAHSGFDGHFSCHTTDGGYLHFSCSTQKSCSYMEQLMKHCAVPSIDSDPKVLDKLIIKDNSCTSPLNPTVVSSNSITCNTYDNGLVVTKGNFVMEDTDCSR